MKSKIAGILGSAAATAFTAAAVISILMFEDGIYSPLNCFVTELGLYTGGFMIFSSALVFNIGLILSGILFSAFMVIYGLRNGAPLHTAVSFFGVLSGILMAAQGLFSLNYYAYHYLLASAFFVTLFIMCVFYIVSKMLSASLKQGLVSTIIACLTAAAAALSAGYMITGGMAQVFAEDASGVGRANIIPYAVIGWAAYVLLFIFIVLLSVRMLSEKEDPSKPKSDSSSIDSGNNKKLAKPKRSDKTPAHSYR